MGSDDEASASDDGSLRTAGQTLDSVPVDLQGAAVAKLRCKLCSCKATDKSPLAGDSHINFRHMEWRQYWQTKIQCVVVQCPSHPGFAEGTVHK